MALWSIRPDGTGLLRVAAAPWRAGDWSVPVSADGRRLLLPSDDELVMLDDEGRRRLASGTTREAAWSPDGERIVFRRLSPGLSPGLSIIGVDGTGGRRLTRTDGDAEPAWSPDGEQIAFWRQDVGLMLLEADGTNERLLWRGTGQGIRWAPDGRTLSFVDVNFDTGVDTLLTVDVDTRRIVRRARGSFASSYEPLAWSPDGTRVAYEEWEEQGDSAVSRLVTVNADGSGRRVVLNDAGGYGGVLWSRDGRSLIYTRRGLGGYQLFETPARGGTHRRITRAYPDGGSAHGPVWARIAFRHAPSRNRLRTSRTSEVTRLTVPFPVIALAGDGATVVAVSDKRIYAPAWYVTPPLSIWNAERNTVTRFNLGDCDAPDAAAITPRVLSYTCRGVPHAVAYYWGSIHVVDRRRLVPRELAAGDVNAENRAPGALPGRIAAMGNSVCYSVNAFDGRAHFVHTRVVCDGRTISRLGEPLAMQGRRVVVESVNGAIAVVDVSGRVLHRLNVAPRNAAPSAGGRRSPPTAALSADHLVVLRRGELLVFDTKRFRVVARRRAGADAVLGGVADGLVAYVVERRMHVFRIRDGRQTVITPPHRYRISALLTTAGLFHTSHGTPVPEYQHVPSPDNPATVVFVRRPALERALA
jgi:Tol biopolymer transport system component